MQTVHINGMGLVGCLLALRLEEAGVGFSWYDNDSPFTAWKASTGCCYPSDEPYDAANYERIAQLLGSHTPNLGRFTEVGNFAFIRKTIPHAVVNTKLYVVATAGNVKVLNKPSYHLNVQQFVMHMRKTFQTRYTEAADCDALVVHAHGFHGKYHTSYRWGWSCKANVKLNAQLAQFEPISLNAQTARFDIFYLYPCPGTEEYYLGTSMVYLRKPKLVKTAPAVRIGAALAHIHEHSLPQIIIEPIDGTYVQGWRPACDEAIVPPVREVEGQLYLKPQSHSGWRHHPLFLDDVMAEIQKRLS